MRKRKISIDFSVFREDDFEPLLIAHNSTKLSRLTLSYPFPVSKAAVQKWIKARITPAGNFPTEIYYAIRDRRTDNLVGYTMLHEINWINKTAELGIVVFEGLENQGIGTQVYDLILEKAKLKFALRKLYAKVIESNIPSRNFFSNRGFKQEGILKKYVFVDSNYQDLYILALEI